MEQLSRKFSKELTLENIKSEKANDFFSQVIDYVKLLSVVTKQLVALPVNDKNDKDFEIKEKTLVEHSKRTAEVTCQLSYLINNVNKTSNNMEMTVTERYLNDAITDLQKRVVTLIRAKQSHFSNPLSAFAQQDLETSTLALVDSIKNLIAAAQAFKSEVGIPPTAPVRTTVKKNDTGTPIIVVSSSSQSSNPPPPKNLSVPKTTPTTVADSSEKQFDIVTMVTDVNNTMQKLLEGLNSNTFQKQDFLSTVKDIVSGTNKLLIMSKELGLEGDEVNLKEASVNFVTASKAVFKAPKDKVARHQLTLAAKATSDTMKVLIFHSSSVNKNINETLSQYTFGTFRGLTVTSNRRKAKSNQKRKMRIVAMNIVRYLSTQYPEFSAAWENQIDNKMETSLQGIETELERLGEVEEQDTNLMELINSPSLSKQRKEKTKEEVQSNSKSNTTETIRQRRLSIVPSVDMQKLLHIIQMPEESGINGILSPNPESIGQNRNSTLVTDTINNGNTRPVTTIIRQRANILSNPLEISLPSQLKLQADIVNSNVIDILTTVKQHIKSSEYDEEALIENVNAFYKAIIGILLATKSLCSSEIIYKVLESVVTEISKTATKASEEEINMKLEIDYCLEKVSSVVTGLKSIGLQLMASLSTIPENAPPPALFSTFFVIISCSKSLTDLVNKLPPLLETYHFLKLKEDEENSEEKFISSNENKDPNIWTERSTPIKTESGQLTAGNLNHIIVEITSSDSHDSKMLKTFLTTFKSFATPLEVLEKLIQRFNVPGIVPLSQKERKTIQFRVCVVLQQWVKTQFSDFTGQVLEKLIDFLDNDVQKHHPNFREEIHLRIEKKIEERGIYMKNLSFEPPTTLQITDNRAPLNLFLAYNDSEIARQLTQIDFSLFNQIRPYELLNQAWSKPELKHLSPHVTALIDRINKVSYWVASLILWFKNKEDRIKMIEKLLKICEELRTINNYGTLMAFTSGLSMVPIDRLKKTISTLSEKTKKELLDLQELFSPTGAWKNYRETTAKVSGACLPYLGVYLHDLTFAEENQNFIPDPFDSSRNYINFGKCEVLYNIISQFDLFQQIPYDFPIVEPIHTFLLELPCLSEKDLYNLSLNLEPRTPSHELLTPLTPFSLTSSSSFNNKSPEYIRTNKFKKEKKDKIMKRPGTRDKRSGTVA